MLDLELHCHTRWSGDSLTKLPDLIARCKEVGIQRLAITDHSEIEGALQARKLAPELIIVGEEALTDVGEILCYFITELIPDGLSLGEAIDRVHAQGGICGPSHPYDPRRRGIGGENLRRHAHQLDFVEVFNARTRNTHSNDEARILAKALDLPMLCASDAHTLPEVGISRVRFTRDYTSPYDFLAALREAELITHYSGLRANVGSRLAAAAHGLGLGKPS